MKNEEYNVACNTDIWNIYVDFQKFYSFLDDVEIYGNKIYKWNRENDPPTLEEADDKTVNLVKVYLHDGLMSAIHVYENYYMKEKK